MSAETTGAAKQQKVRDRQTIPPSPKTYVHIITTW
jgi:hypothetical protein